MSFIEEFETRPPHAMIYQRVSKNRFFIEIEKLFDYMDSVGLEVCDCVVVTEFDSLYEFLNEAEAQGYTTEFATSYYGKMYVYILEKNSNAVVAHVTKDGRVVVVGLLKERRH